MVSSRSRVSVDVWIMLRDLGKPKWVEYDQQVSESVVSVRKSWILLSRFRSFVTETSAICDSAMHF